MERHGIVRYNDRPVTLLGEEMVVGEPAPRFVVLDPAFEEVVPLQRWAGRILVVNSLVSVDSAVCDQEIRRLEARAAILDPGVAVLTVSMDLPFALRRYRSTVPLSWVVTLSDHRDALFGIRYGVLVKEMRLLARAVFVIDGHETVRHAQYVPEMTEEPDYDRVWDVVMGLVG